MTKKKIITKLVLLGVLLSFVIIAQVLDTTNLVNNSPIVLIFFLITISLFSTLLFREESKYSNYIDMGTFVVNIYVLLLIITNFIIMPAQVDGQSMMPTYKDKDRVFVYVFNPKYEINDIIVYQTQNELLIKRLVAKSGDTISMELDSETNTYYLYINGQIYKNKYDQKYELSTYSELYDYLSLHGNSYVLKEDEIIFLGDNANNSRDSRAIGVSSTNQLIGIVIGG